MNWGFVFIGAAAWLIGTMVATLITGSLDVLIGGLTQGLLGYAVGIYIANVAGD